MRHVHRMLVGKLLCNRYSFALFRFFSFISSVLYGQGGFGGVINLVSKRPLAAPRGEVDVQIGSFGRKQLAFDLTGAADREDRLLYRLVALGRDSGTQVDYVPDDRLLVAPSFTWKPRRSTTLTVLANFQQDRSGSSVGFFPWQGTLLPHPIGQIPTDTFNPCRLWEIP